MCITSIAYMCWVYNYGSRERHFFHCLPHDVCFRMQRLAFRVRRIISACGEWFPHADTRVLRAEDRLRPVFRVRRNVSACGDSCSACGDLFSGAETLVPRAEECLRMRAKLRMLRKRILHMIGTYTSFSSEDYAPPHGTPRRLLLS